MKFFIPYTDRRKAEPLWAEVRQALREAGLPTTARRIQALTLANARSEHVLAVGMSTPDSEEPILMILEASDAGVYYACTPSHGVDEGAPFILGLGEYGRVIDFEEDAVDRLWANYLK